MLQSISSLTKEAVQFITKPPLSPPLLSEAGVISEVAQRAAEGIGNAAAYKLEENKRQAISKGAGIASAILLTPLLLQLSNPGAALTYRAALFLAVQIAGRALLK